MAPAPRCDAALRDALQRRLAAWPRQALDEPGLRRAAVVIAVVEAGGGADLPGLPRHAGWSDEAALLLTRRPRHLDRHAGQWALPGGRIDDGETAAAAALRELQEELGLELGADALLGALDDYATRSGYVITPFVAWAGRAEPLEPDPGEVASVHRIPLAELLRADAPLLDPPHDAGGPPVLRLPLGPRADSWVAAPTAALLYQFREVGLLDRATRVAHFDQPRFTWR
ncbi:MAG: NUDIX hydrolase [Pseudomonadota bacterium]